jgi:hypothetical protein
MPCSRSCPPPSPLRLSPLPADGWKRRPGRPERSRSPEPVPPAAAAPAACAVTWAASRPRDHRQSPLWPRPDTPGHPPPVHGLVRFRPAGPPCDLASTRPAWHRGPTYVNDGPLGGLAPVAGLRESHKRFVGSGPGGLPHNRSPADARSPLSRRLVRQRVPPGERIPGHGARQMGDSHVEERRDQDAEAGSFVDGTFVWA